MNRQQQKEARTLAEMRKLAAETPETPVWVDYEDDRLARELLAGKAGTPKLVWVLFEDNQSEVWLRVKWGELVIDSAGRPWLAKRNWQQFRCMKQGDETHPERVVEQDLRQLNMWHGPRCMEYSDVQPVWAALLARKLPWRSTHWVERRQGLTTNSFWRVLVNPAPWLDRGIRWGSLHDGTESEWVTLASRGGVEEFLDAFEAAKPGMWSEVPMWNEWEEPIVRESMYRVESEFRRHRRELYELRIAARGALHAAKAKRKSRAERRMQKPLRKVVCPQVAFGAVLQAVEAVERTANDKVEVFR